MIDANVWAGVQSFLDDYVHLRADDTVVLAYTSDSHEATAWVSAALQLREVPATRVWMAPLRAASKSSSSGAESQKRKDNRAAFV